jgi:hypothetical protein
MAIAASSLPKNFRKVIMVLAREPGHPEGAADDRYTLVVPLTMDGHVAAADVAAHAEVCRVISERDGDRQIGHLNQDENGIWRTVFDVEGDGDDEVWFRLADERLIPGEYVSLDRENGQHTFKIIAVTEL